MVAAHNKPDSMVDRRPLLLLTRPESAARAFWAELPEDVRQSVDVLISPLLSIHVTGHLPDLSDIKGLIFTSSNGLDAYMASGGQVGSTPVVAVGENTASAARSLGFKVEMAGGNADQVVQYIIGREYSGPFLHVRGEASIGDIALRLSNAGVPTSEAILYDQRLERLTAEAREALSQDRYVLAPVFSSRTAKQLRSESEDYTHLRFAAISDAVAKVLSEGEKQRVQVSRRPNREGMLELVTEMVASAVALERRQGQL